MPVVPVREVSTVTTRVGANEPTSPLSGLASGLETGANALSPVALDIQMRENADYVMQAEIALRDAEREHRLAINERKGTDAFGVTQDSEAWWGEKAQEIGGNLKNDAQREMFFDLAQERRQVSLDSISGYEAAERRNSFNESSASIIESAIDDAAASPYNPATIEMESKRIKETLADLADSNGWTPEMADAELATHMTKLHAGVVSALMADSPPAAQAYFKEHRNEISGPERATMDAMITEKMIDHTAQGLAESYYTDLDSITDARKKVRDIKDPALQKATRAAVNAMFADETSARTQAQSLAGDGVRKLLSDDHTLQKKDIDPILWEMMSGADQLAVEGYISARDKAKINAVTIDDFEVLRRAEQQIEANLIRTPEDLEPFMPYLQETTRERLRKAAAKNEVLNLGELRKAFEARIGKKRDVVEGKSKWDKKHWEQWERVQDYARNRVAEGAQAKDVASLIDELYLEGQVANTSFWVNDPETLGQALIDGRANEFIFESPDLYRGVLEEVAAPLNTTADQLYTKGGRDAIAILVKYQKPVTAANLKYILDQMNAD